MPLLHCANTERVAAGTRTGRAAGVYYWSGFIADLSDLVRIRNDTRQCTFDRLSASGYPLEMAQPQYQQWLEDHLTHNPEDLHLQPAGKIYLAETPWFNISATIIRERLQNGESCEDLLLEPY